MVFQSAVFDANATLAIGEAFDRAWTPFTTSGNPI